MRSSSRLRWRRRSKRRSYCRLRRTLGKMGGGGGQKGLTAVTKGKMPKIADLQKPKLTMPDPTVNVQKDLKMADNNMPNFGDPNSPLLGNSMGRGSGTGMGNGTGSGIGIGVGWRLWRRSEADWRRSDRAEDHLPAGAGVQRRGAQGEVHGGGDGEPHRGRRPGNRRMCM